ncbi:MAG: hypothetical protein J6J12_07185 [Oscillospiraceae bacterium]|nr:hypothetical protein [Oscillospiraceae bacterium]
MNELEEQKKDLRVALAAAKLKEDLGLKKEHIVFFLHQFAGMDYSDIECQKRLIKTFLNSVFVYDDKVVLTFNYSGDDRTITLHEIDGGLGHSIRIPSAVIHQKKRQTSACLFFVVRESNPYGSRKAAGFFPGIEKIFSLTTFMPIPYNILIHRKGGMDMKIRKAALWRLPVYFMAASWVSFYLTVYIGGFFFTVKTVGADGVTELSADPVRSALFHGAMLLLAVFVARVWALRGMTRKEIAVSAAITAGFYLIVVLAQLVVVGFPLSLSMELAKFQNLTGIVSSWLLQLTGQFELSVLAACFTPFLFVITGGKRNPE